MNKREIDPVQFQEKLAIYRGDLDRLKDVLDESHENRYESYTRLFGDAMSTSFYNNIFDTALDNLNISRPKINASDFMDTQYGNFILLTLGMQENPVKNVTKYYKAYERGEGTTAIAEELHPGFGLKTGMLGVEFYYRDQLYCTNQAREDFQQNLQDSPYVARIEPYMDVNLKELRANRFFYDGCKAKGLMPVDAEHLMGVTMNVIKRLQA